MCNINVLCIYNVLSSSLSIIFKTVYSMHSIIHFAVPLFSLLSSSLLSWSFLGLFWMCHNYWVPLTFYCPCWLWSTTFFTHLPYFWSPISPTSLSTTLFSFPFYHPHLFTCCVWNFPEGWMSCLLCCSDYEVQQTTILIKLR